jgi:hypothetical protein
MKKAATSLSESGTVVDAEVGVQMVVVVDAVVAAVLVALLVSFLGAVKG